jgi:hypothetical protein
MALGSTQPLTETGTRNLLGGKGRPARKADNLTIICEPTVYKMWEPRRLTALWAFMACYRDRFTFFHITIAHLSFGKHGWEENAKYRTVKYTAHA